MDKTSLRRQLRTVIASITDKAEQSKAIAEILQNTYLPSGSICIYNSLPSEVDTKAIIERFCVSRKVYLPVVEGEDMLLVEVNGDTQYTVGRWGISEPIGKRLLPRQVKPSVTLTPLLGVDRQLNRLGKGKGYYDRYFAAVDTYRVGLAFEQQIVDSMLCDGWDKPLDMLVTSRGVIKRQNTL